MGIKAEGVNSFSITLTTNERNGMIGGWTLQSCEDQKEGQSHLEVDVLCPFSAFPWLYSLPGLGTSVVMGCDTAVEWIILHEWPIPFSVMKAVQLAFESPLKESICHKEKWILKANSV